MDFRMKCLLCSRSVLVLERRDRTARYLVDCPRCGPYRMSSLFAATLEDHPDRARSWDEGRRSLYQRLVRDHTTAGSVFTFQWQDIQPPQGN